VLARPLLRHALIACVAVAAVAGCSDGGAPPQTLPPATQSPTATAIATPTSTPTAGSLQRSAEQFVRQYVAALTRANSAADPSELVRDYYDPNCRSCQFDVRTLRNLNRKRQRIEGYETDLEKVSAGDLEGNTIAVTVELRNEAGRVVDESGKTVRTLPASGLLRVHVIVARSGQRWRITEIVPLGEVK
jgi:hypothetical protein